jgi:hypothetical protein
LKAREWLGAFLCVVAGASADSLTAGEAENALCFSINLK